MNVTIPIPINVNDEDVPLFKEYEKLGGLTSNLLAKIYEYMEDEFNHDRPHFLQQSKEPITLRKLFNQHISHIVAAEIQKMKDRKETEP